MRAAAPGGPGHSAPPQPPQGADPDPHRDYSYLVDKQVVLIAKNSVPPGLDGHVVVTQPLFWCARRAAEPLAASPRARQRAGVNATLQVSSGAVWH